MTAKNNKQKNSNQLNNVRKCNQRAASQKAADLILKSSKSKNSVASARSENKISELQELKAEYIRKQNPQIENPVYSEPEVDSGSSTESADDGSGANSTFENLPPTQHSTPKPTMEQILLQMQQMQQNFNQKQLEQEERHEKMLAEQEEKFERKFEAQREEYEEKIKFYQSGELNNKNLEEGEIQDPRSQPWESLVPQGIAQPNPILNLNPTHAPNPQPNPRTTASGSDRRAG